LIERSYNGTKDIELGSGEKRRWIQDGDEIKFEGWIHEGKTGERLFGFGDCTGIVVPLQ
jgi:fumarylacetoacetase